MPRVARRARFVAALLLLCAAAAAGCAGRSGIGASPGAANRQVSRDEVLAQTTTPVYGFRILRTYPHDRTSYTEGLMTVGGTLYEGTGLYGQSKLRAIDLATGRLLRETELSRRYFGEGITVLGNEIFQLTYKSNTGFVYDRDSLDLKRRFRYPSQGWGLTNDGARLIMSNGSAALVFLDPASLEQTGYVVVARDDGNAVGFLNELEYIDGKVYANVWQTDLIVVAAADTGKVVAWIDLTGLNPEPDTLVFP
jgi:glutamine cyclotransferase